MNLNGTSAADTIITDPRRRRRLRGSNKNSMNRKRSLQGQPAVQHVVEQRASTANANHTKDAHHPHSNGTNNHHTNTSNNHHASPSTSPTASSSGVLLHERIAIIVISTDGDFVFSHTHPLGEAYESSTVEDVQEEEEVDEEVDEGVQEEKRKAEKREEMREEKEEKRREEKKEEKRQKKEGEGIPSKDNADNAALYQQFHSPHSNNNNINNHQTTPRNAPSHPR